MIFYNRDPNGSLFANVENKSTKERFVICNAFNNTMGIWQQAVLGHRGAGVWFAIKAFFAPHKTKPLIMCETHVREEAEENVKILAKLFEKKSSVEIIITYGQVAMTQHGNDVAFFDKNKWKNKSN